MTTTAIYDYRVKTEVNRLKWEARAKKIVAAGYFDPAWLDMQGSPGFLGRGTFVGENRSGGYRRR